MNNEEVPCFVISMRKQSVMTKKAIPGINRFREGGETLTEINVPMAWTAKHEGNITHEIACRLAARYLSETLPPEEQEEFALVKDLLVRGVGFGVRPMSVRQPKLPHP